MNTRVLGLALVAGLANAAAGQCVSDWEQVIAPVRPSPRFYSSMVFDSARGVSVLFGGESPNGLLYQDTWEFNGTTWAQRPTTAMPQPGSGFSMAYDSARGVTVLFGGGAVTAVVALYNETWEWNGSAWYRRITLNSPSVRQGAAMAYDSARRVCVLFGGSDFSFASQQDTWEYDGTNWVNRNPSVKPAPRRNATMAYDRARGVCVLAGGTIVGTDTTLWEWNGSVWMARLPGTTTAPNSAELRTSQMVYDASRRVCVLRPREIGGVHKVFEWDGSQWTVESPAHSSTAPFQGWAFAFDERLGLPVLFGGDSLTSSDETWVWDSSKVTIAAGPQNRDVSVGQPVTLSVSAGGTAPISFRWRKGGVALGDGPTMTGAGTPTLTIPSASTLDEGIYDCVVTGACGQPQVSSPAMVKVGGGCYANCDGSTSTPILTVNDFQCFLGRFMVGCP